eukprot:scaffold940_cov569-Prasinococcus_capsulatus_cf.AAC.4
MAWLGFARHPLAVLRDTWIMHVDLRGRLGSYLGGLPSLPCHRTYPGQRSRSPPPGPAQPSVS